MFKFFKEKIKSAISSIVQKIEKKPDIEKKEPVPEVKILEKVKEIKPQVIIKEEAKPQKVVESVKEEKKGFFEKLKEKITTTKISNEEFEDIFWDLELAMLENNVAVEVIDKIKMDLKKELVETPISKGNIEERIKSTLMKSIENLFIIPDKNILSLIKEKKKNLL